MFFSFSQVGGKIKYICRKRVAETFGFKHPFRRVLGIPAPLPTSVRQDINFMYISVCICVCVFVILYPKEYNMAYKHIYTQRI